ncbi:unnamed protein product [Chironomus riparius]|uniref:Uncharacterized protein n=1 Tax=Chironomus riparius TaxID=315576 RepID=A0A9N9RHR1_9DIPT|nr:unnamed protein product [Chironomus riparius]
MEVDAINIGSKIIEHENTEINNNFTSNDEEPVTEKQNETVPVDLGPQSTASKEYILTNEVLNQDLSQIIHSNASCIHQLKLNISKEDVLETKSKTCINCGDKYENYKKYIQSVASKSSSREKFKPKKSVPESRSKCSQLSKNYSHRSLAPCQSFDQCSKCNQVIFATNPSCASFDHCKRCEKSRENISHNSCNSQSHNLKARSVTFSPCYGNVSKMHSFCGCSSTLKCNKHCKKELQHCADTISNKSTSNMTNYPPKEPSQLSMMKKMLQERVDACSNVELKTYRKRSKDIKHISLSKKRRYRIKNTNKDNDDLACPSNPCCLSNERKKRLETVTNKLVQREGIRQKEIQQKREEKLKRLQKNDCEDLDQCKKDGQCPVKESNDKCKAYCKKYKKMKYEIELQNYLVDKLNRELQIKTFKKYQESTLLELKNIIQKEIMKLKEMIDFTIFEQCQNKDLGWGSIPISSLTTNTIKMPQPSCGLPKTPSSVSNVSTFSMLEDLNLCQEKEKVKIQLEFENNRQKHITAILDGIQKLEYKISELKSVQLQLLNEIESLSNKKSNDKRKLKKTKIKAKSQSSY